MKKFESKYLVYPIALAIISIFLAFKSNFVSDLFWHMTAGRWMVENQDFLSKDLFSFVYEGAEWINITWVFQVMAYLFHESFGYPGTLALVALFGTLSILISWATFTEINNTSITSSGRNSHFNSLLAFVIFFLSLFALERRWIPRPEIFSTVFIALEIFILTRVNLDPAKSKMIWLLPVIFLVWVNSHSYFILGYLVFGAAWISRPKMYLLPLMASILASLINPYGLKGALYPFFLKKVSEDTSYRLISEGRFLFDPGVPSIYHVSWAIWLLFVPFSVKPGMKAFGKGYLFLLAFLIYFSTTMLRNLAPCVLIALPFIASGVVSMASRALQGIRAKTLPYLQTVNIALVIVMTLSATLLIQNNRISQIRAGFYFGDQISENGISLKAADFVIRHQLDSRVFADSDFSSYMMFNRPGFKTYIDSRFAEVVPLKHFNNQASLLLDPSKIPNEVRKYGIETIVLEHNKSTHHAAIDYLYKSTDWKLVHLDQTSVIFIPVEKTAIQRLDSKDIDQITKVEIESFLQAKVNGIDELIKIDQVVGAAILFKRLEIPTRALPQLIQKTEYPPLLDRQCTVSAILSQNNTPRFDYVNGMGESSEQACRKAFLKNDSFTGAFNLAYVLFESNRPKEAYEYFKKATKISPYEATGYLGIAESLISAGKINSHLKEIEENYRKALFINSSMRIAYLRLGQTYEATGNLKSAILEYERALNIQKDSSLKDHVEKLKNRLL